MHEVLNSFYVNNFRSLQNFNLNINSGLNVLVGPNGSGKTNIVKWLEFLSLLGNSSLREAIGKLGGANHVFRRNTSGAYSTDLDFSFSGYKTVYNKFDFDEEADKIEKFGAFYSYSGQISILDNQIFFSRQNLRLWLTEAPTPSRPNSSPNLHIDWAYDILSDQISSSIESRSPRGKRFKGSNYIRYAFDELDHMKAFINNKIMAENLIAHAKFYPFELTSFVTEDLHYGRAYNINPSSVRSTLDISSPPGVQFDGAGVASTLYDLRVSIESRSGGRYRLRRRSAQEAGPTFQRIIDYFKLSNPAIQNITVDLDNFKNEFTLTVEFNFDKQNYTVPMSLLSDGTVKWLALVTAIATDKATFYVEEPENFLHPKLQESIISILRSEVTEGSSTRFAIITTHSETLLNTLRPEEIIITRMEDGRTVAERLDDPNEISEIINQSGFGLGYFYVTGGF